MKQHFAEWERLQQLMKEVKEEDVIPKKDISEREYHAEEKPFYLRFIRKSEFCEDKYFKEQSKNNLERGEHRPMTTTNNTILIRDPLAERLHNTNEFLNTNENKNRPKRDKNLRENQNFDYRDLEELYLMKAEVYLTFISLFIRTWESFRIRKDSKNFFRIL